MDIRDMGIIGVCILALLWRVTTPGSHSFSIYKMGTTARCGEIGLSSQHYRRSGRRVPTVQV